MTVVPLPDVSTIKVRLVYTTAAVADASTRLFFSYAGSAPSADNCVTLAGDIKDAWVAQLASLVTSNFALVEVDVLDIATDSGNFGSWEGSELGTRGGGEAPIQCALGIEYNIPRRYRGGKPRCYLPAGTLSDLDGVAQWTADFITEVETAFPAFISAVEALSVGAVGALAHINLSYYKGFTNITNSSGRERAVPKYRDTALSDIIDGYAPKKIISSQKRRRTSTTP